MESLIDVLEIIGQNFVGLIIALGVYLHMRNKMQKAKATSFNNGMVAREKEMENQMAHLEKMSSEFYDTFTNANRELDHAFRFGIAEGIAWEKREPWKDINSDYLFRALGDIGPEYNYFARMPASKEFKEMYYFQYGYDEIKHLKDASNALEYAFKAGVITGVVYDYEVKGELVDDELIYSAIKEAGYYRSFDYSKKRYVDSYLGIENEK